MRGAVSVVQGKKGTGDDKVQVGLRTPKELVARLTSSAGPGGTVTSRALRAMQDSVELEEAAGERLRELQASAILEGKSFGAVVAELALEGLDARKKRR